MIGNDIVDLAIAEKESNWTRKGFLDKIFTKMEQFLILESENQTVMVWNLWSRKEAAYKIYNRQTKIRGYFPHKIECSDIETINNYTFGTVKVNDIVYYTKTEIGSEFIYTESLENLQGFCKIKLLESRINIQKNNGLPEYVDSKTNITKPVSICHHGRFERIICI
jgi:phosphopantetheinyl transferase (holo-ACP synthase)